MGINTANKSLKILFVQPSQLNEDGSVWKTKIPWLPRLALPQLAAITPEDIQTKIIDEYTENIDFNTDADLIAISATTIQAPRAYQISEEFRKRGKKTIIGGMHASLVPDEAIKYADSILIGEAEGIWSELIKDFRNNSLKAIYQYNGEKIDITNITSPNLKKINLKKYKVPFRLVQTTRGCPHNCEFCAVTKFFGKSYRHRCIDDVVKELEKLDSKEIFFVDDNIAANPKRAKELFKAIAPLKLSWISQCCASIAYDEELLELAQKSGCVSLLLGLESISSSNLQSVNKSFNKINDYHYVIEKLHQYGITVLGSIIFGLDHDDETVFEKTVKFVEDSKIDFPIYWILTPYPNTPLYDKLEAEGRIIERDWSKYDCTKVVFQPKLMSPDTLKEGYKYAYKKSYSASAIAKRLYNIPLSSPAMTKRLILKGEILDVLFYNLLIRHNSIKGYNPMVG